MPSNPVQYIISDEDKATADAWLDYLGPKLSEVIAIAVQNALKRSGMVANLAAVRLTTERAEEVMPPIRDIKTDIRMDIANSIEHLSPGRFAELAPPHKSETNYERMLHIARNVEKRQVWLQVYSRVFADKIGSSLPEYAKNSAVVAADNAVLQLEKHINP